MMSVEFEGKRAKKHNKESSVVGLAVSFLGCCLSTEESAFPDRIFRGATRIDHLTTMAHIIFKVGWTVICNPKHLNHVDCHKFCSRIVQFQRSLSLHSQSIRVYRNFCQWQ